MKITVLDGYTLNPGDNPWDPLTELSELTVYERTKPDEIAERAADSDIVILNKTEIKEADLKRMPKLKLISVLAAGYNVVDVKAAGEHGVIVCNTPAYGVDAVAQHAVALLMEFCRNIAEHDDSVKAGEWASAKDWCYWKTPQRELSGLTMGIVGFGHNGRRVGELAHAFGMNVISFTVPQTNPPAYQPFNFVSLKELFQQSDVISLHCPLTDDTFGMINSETIAQMKQEAIIINTSRGQIINERDVADALHSGKLGGYGTDVLSIEPPTSDNPLLKAPNTLITPHIAWATLKARQNIMKITADNVRAFIANSPQNIVNGPFLR